MPRATGGCAPLSSRSSKGTNIRDAKGFSVGLCKLYVPPTMENQSEKEQEIEIRFTGIAGFRVPGLYPNNGVPSVKENGR